MPFKSPLNSALTENQNKALSKINSLQSYVSAPESSFQNLTEEQQVSTFDLSLKFLSSLSGPQAADGVLKKFLDKVFESKTTDGGFLENTIVNALANSLDAKGKHLAPQPDTGSTVSQGSGNTVSGGTIQPVEENQVEEFSQFQNLEYLFTSSVVQTTGGTEDITIVVETNAPTKLPTFTLLYPSSQNSLPVEDVLDLVKYNADNSGFYENDISYPKSGTLIDSIPELTGNIVGTVIDSSGDTIPSVKIELLNTNPTVVLRSNVEGNFEINNLKKGEYNIKASSTSYKSEIIKSFEVKYDKNNNINFQLDFTGHTVTATATTINNSESEITDASGNTVGNNFTLPTQPSEELESNIPVGTITPLPTIQVSNPEDGLTFNESGEFSNIFDAGFNQDDVGLTNKEYLNKYLKPALTAGKRVLVGAIIAMVFGPKELMSDDPEEQEMLLNSAACGEKMFSVTNNPSVTEKELEFNRVRLKKQLENGKIELTISCQKIEISLPENYIEEFDLESSDDIGIPESERPNPANSFTLLANYVQTETQRQRNQEDSSAVNKTFFELIVEKIMQYISVAFSVSPEISSVFNVLNSGLAASGEEPESPASLLSNPCEITQACDSGNKKEFKEKSAFSSTMINSLYSLALSMILRKLITEAKAQIKKLIQKKAQEKIQKLMRKQQNRFKNSNSNISSGGKSSEYKSAFSSSGLGDIMNFRDNNNA